MVRLVYNLADLSFFDPSLYSYILLPPSRYRLRRLIRDRFNVPCFLDVDFREARLTPKRLAYMQLTYAMDGDVIVAPDSLGDLRSTLSRVKAWLEALGSAPSGKRLHLLAPLQFKTYDEALTCLNAYLSMGFDYIGLGYFTCKSAGLDVDQVIDLAETVKAVGCKLHLLGFSISKYKQWLPLFRLADTLDTSSVANVSIKNLDRMVREALRVVNNQLTLL